MHQRPGKSIPSSTCVSNQSQNERGRDGYIACVTARDVDLAQLSRLRHPPRVEVSPELAVAQRFAALLLGFSVLLPQGGDHIVAFRQFVTHAVRNRNTAVPTGLIDARRAAMDASRHCPRQWFPSVRNMRVSRTGRVPLGVLFNNVQ